MGHPLRWYEPGAIYEVTSRTIREQYLLRPCPESRELALGIIGRALALFPLVRLYAFVYLSNHFHMLLSSDDGESIADFVGYVNGNLAREIGRLRKSPGKLWAGRMKPIRIVDDDALLERFLYVLEQGCKEGLVASPRDWPGVSAVPGLLGDMMMYGVWRDRDACRRDRRRGRAIAPGAHEIVYPIPITPLPIWAHLSRDELRARHTQIVDDIERATRVENARLGRRPLGVAKVLAQDPFARPDDPKRAPAPICHASTIDGRNRYQNAYDLFVATFHAAADTMRATPPAPPFPPNSFPCPPRFIRGPAAGCVRLPDG